LEIISFSKTSGSPRRLKKSTGEIHLYQLENCRNKISMIRIEISLFKLVIDTKTNFSWSGY